MLLDWEDELRDYERAVDLSDRSVVGARFVVFCPAPCSRHSVRPLVFAALPPYICLMAGQTRGCLGCFRASICGREAKTRPMHHALLAACGVGVRPPCPLPFRSFVLRDAGAVNLAASASAWGLPCRSLPPRTYPPRRTRWYVCAIPAS